MVYISRKVITEPNKPKLFPLSRVTFYISFTIGNFGNKSNRETTALHRN